MRIPLYFDFDRVLYDTDLLRKQIESVLVQAGYPPEATHRAYRQVAAGKHYTPELHLDVLQALYPEISQHNLLSTLYGTLHNYLYPGVPTLLSNLNTETYLPALLTLGDKEFQQEKVSRCFIDSHLEEFHYCTVEKWHYLSRLVRPTAQLVLIDDRLDTLQHCQPAFPNGWYIYRDTNRAHTKNLPSGISRITQVSQIADLTPPPGYASLVLH